MVSRLLGALFRAFMVALLFAVPCLIIPNVSNDATQFALLAGGFAAVLVFIEYAADSPILIEFRDAPPYNRVRYISLLLLVVLSALLLRGAHGSMPLANFIYALGSALGGMLDFAYSPVRMMVLVLPPEAGDAAQNAVRAAASLALLIGMVTIIYFAIKIRFLGWPGRNGVLNILTNLPMFDPTSGGDVLERLYRGARLNMMLGFLLPFIVPACIKASGRFLDPLHFDNPLSMVWIIALWAFVPVVFYLRGLAMARLAYLVSVTRKKRYAETADEHAYA